MSQEHEHRCSLAWRRVERGITRSSPWKILGDSQNPGLVVECVSTGGLYVREDDGKLIEITDGQTLRKLRSTQWRNTYEQKQEDGRCLAELQRLARSFPGIAVSILVGTFAGIDQSEV